MTIGATSVATARPVELYELVGRGRSHHLLASEFVAGVYWKLGDIGGFVNANVRQATVFGVPEEGLAELRRTTARFPRPAPRNLRNFAWRRSSWRGSHAIDRCGRIPDTSSRKQPSKYLHDRYAVERQ